MELSFEFFPPRTDAQREKLAGVQQALASLQPAFCSMTFGAGGSTQDATREAVLDIQRQGYAQAVPHVSCMGGTAEDLFRLLTFYRDRGIDRVVALRGDRPSGSVGDPELPHAGDLVALIRERFGDHFHIDVACYPETHPESGTMRRELDFFARKVEAGANAAITQYFYNVDAYVRFVDGCRRLGITVPIVPGVMPITNYQQLAAFSERCGAEIPRWLAKRLADFGDDLAGLREFGAEFVGSFCRKLLEAGAPGLHVYTLNRSQATRNICQAVRA